MLLGLAGEEQRDRKSALGVGRESKAQQNKSTRGDLGVFIKIP